MPITFDLPPEGAQTQPAKRWRPIDVAMCVVIAGLLLYSGVTWWHKQHPQSLAGGVDLSQYDTATVEHVFPDRHPGQQDGTYVHAVGSCDLATTPGAVGTPIVFLEATQLPAGGSLPVTVAGNGPARTDVLRVDANGWTDAMWAGPAGGTVTLTITQDGHAVVLRVTLPTQCALLHEQR